MIDPSLYYWTMIAFAFWALVFMVFFCKSKCNGGVSVEIISKEIISKETILKESSNPQQQLSAIV